MEDKIKEAKKEIAKIISEGVEYSPQLRTMVIHDAVEKLLKREQDAYNLGKEEDKWISVKTRLPEEGEQVLFCLHK